MIIVLSSLVSCYLLFLRYDYDMVMIEICGGCVAGTFTTTFTVSKKKLHG